MRRRYDARCARERAKGRNERERAREGGEGRERERVGQPVAIAKSLRAKAALIIQISQYSKN